MSYEPSITEFVCALCKDTETRFVGLDLVSFVAHVVETHGWTEQQVKAIKGRTEVFLDGRHGSAQQIANFRDADGVHVLQRVWSSGDFAGPHAEPKTIKGPKKKP
jgi:hypothetical protein